jgi:D-beta-D-heptose 7-phosphate kinase/D-beta-D-heptose 1-phosphate adenosyltransferase
MGEFDRKRLEGLIDGFSRLRLLVVGDLVLDEYVWGDVQRVSPEAPVPVVEVEKETEVLGGAANVARNLIALGAQAEMVSLVGDDDCGGRVVRLVRELGMDPAGLMVAAGRPTTRKTRVIARGQQVVRFDRESLERPSSKLCAKISAAIERLAPSVDGAVIQDYGKGMLSAEIAESAMRCFLDGEIPVVVDPKGSLAPYRGASLVKPNLREAETLSGVTIRDAADLNRAALEIRQQIGGGSLVITRGPRGLTLFEEGRSCGVDVPTTAREVFDVQGAGDTTIAALALAQRAGASLLEASVIANAAAGVVVGKMGTATASAAETCEMLESAMAAAEGASGR